MSIIVASVNVNGLRAASRKGLHLWLNAAKPDVITMQEVRAPDELVRELLPGYTNVVHSECSLPGRAGVLIATKLPISKASSSFTAKGHNFSGRWAQCMVHTNSSTSFTVVSVYVPTGDAQSSELMRTKMSFLGEVRRRLDEFNGHKFGSSGNKYVLVTGDINIAHTFNDLKNGKNNVKNAGFLPSEREWFSQVLDSGWTDVQRHVSKDVPGPYSFWSYRGRAYDNDSGWRVDYQIANKDLSPKIVASRVDKVASYADRWSDHAPCVAAYAL